MVCSWDLHGIAWEGWALYLIGLVSLEKVILYRVVTPLVLFGIYRLRKTRYERTFMRLVTVVGGGLALGFPIWVSVNYILYVYGGQIHRKYVGKKPQKAV